MFDGHIILVIYAAVLLCLNNTSIIKYTRVSMEVSN